MPRTSRAIPSPTSRSRASTSSPATTAPRSSPRGEGARHEGAGAPHEHARHRRARTERSMSGTEAAARLPLTQLHAWQALGRHFAAVHDIHLRALFADDPQRGERLTVEAAGLFLDYSKQRVTDETLCLLVALAEESGLRARID